MLSTKPEFLQNDDYIDVLYKEIEWDKSERETISIVQFTDLHIDLDYVAGTPATCNDILCCRADSVGSMDPSNLAGPYGALAYCDVPETTVQLMADKIVELAPDALFWTGDVPPHDQWNYSQEYEVRYQNWLADFMKKNFSGLATFPLEGNHDFGAIINSQDFTTQDPIIPILADLWSDYLSEEALEQFRVNGFYSEQFHTTDGKVWDNVRVIAVNTEACYNMNFFLMSNRNDPGGILAWLEEELYKMEANGQVGILIGHHPPGGDSTLSGWSKRFQALMDRYQHVIRLSFFGHVHAEKFNTIKAIDSGKPVGINHWSGAMTTFVKSNPSFRRYILDAQTMLPLEIETWKVDVTAESPEFFLDHELTSYYNITDLAPSTIDKLSQSMIDDEAMALQFVQTYTQKGIDMPLECDEKCRLEVHCITSNSVYYDVRTCQGKAGTSVIHDPVNSGMEHLMEPWYEHSRIPHA